MADTGTSAREAGSFDTDASRKGYLSGINVCSRTKNEIRSILEKI
jgi:hypothetical protein